MNSLFFWKSQSRNKQQISFSKILARIVLISIPVLISKLETERNTCSRLKAWDWEKFSKHEIQRTKFSSRKLKQASRWSLARVNCIFSRNVICQRKFSQIFLSKKITCCVHDHRDEHYNCWCWSAGQLWYFRPPTTMFSMVMTKTKIVKAQF